MPGQRPRTVRIAAVFARTVRHAWVCAPALAAPFDNPQDRVCFTELVPLNGEAYAIYQIKPNGNAVFKTILEKRG